MVKEKIQYNPKIFDVNNMQDAKNIILTPEAGMKTDERWKLETEFLAGDIGDFFQNFTKDSVILDFGCGIGRLSKKLIEKFDCKVIGVDISKSMRDLAISYVDSENFKAVSNRELRELVLNGLRFDGAISIWVLQHTLEPIFDTALIEASLKKDALFYVLNNKVTAVPTTKGWKSNGISIYNLLISKFNQLAVSSLPQEVAKDKLHTATFIAKLQNSKSKNLPKELQELLQAGALNYNKKEFVEARKIYTSAIKKFPLYSEAYSALGVVERAEGDVDKAIELYFHALKLNPLNSLVYNNLSNAFKAKKEYKKAINVLYDAIRASNRSNAEFFNSIGILYELVNDIGHAIEAYKSAIKINPKYAKAINNMGVLLYKQKRYDESCSVFKIALEVDPDYNEVYSNMGASLNQAKRYDEAIESLETAIKKMPKHGGAYTNLGNVYNKIFEYKKAAKMHEKSIKLEPNGSNAYSNVGTSYKYMGQTNKAIESYKKAIELQPDFENAHFDLGILYLAKENFKDGLAEYEWRFKKEEMRAHIVKHKHIFSKPMLTRDRDISDKTILVHSEQGFGDSIMYARFIPELKKLCKSVVVECRDELTPLFQSMESVDIAVGRDEEKTPAFDFHLPIMSMAYYFDAQSTEDFLDTPYFNVVKDEEFQLSKSKINIGLCWSASATGESYDGKVFDLKNFESLIKSDKVQVYSLQVGFGSEQIAENGYEDDIIDLTDKLSDFSKTASLMQELDLVISSDTSVAHLAGAIDVKCYTLLQKFPDWRWLLKGETSYLYKSMKLFRQKQARNWKPVFQSLFANLNKEYKLKLKAQK